MILLSSIFTVLFSFINQLKDKKIIDDYVFTFINNNINEKNDKFFENSKNFGKIIVGEYPPSFLSDNIFKKEYKLKHILLKAYWELMFDEINLI